MQNAPCSLGNPFSANLYNPFINANTGLGDGGNSAVVVQSLSHIQLFATRWTAVHQASLSFTISRSLLKLVSIKLVMPSNHLGCSTNMGWMNECISCIQCILLAVLREVT